METRNTKNGKVYREMIFINGKSIKSPFFKRKTDASIWKAKKLTEKEKFKQYGYNPLLSEVKLFKDWAKEWLEGKESSARKTKENYERTIRLHLNPKFAEMDLKKIQPHHGEELIAHLKKNHNAKGINLITTLLKTILNDARKRGFVLSTPFESLKKVKGEIRRENYWSIDEAEQFLKANEDDHYYDFYVVALNTGMRRGELAGLCWDKVDFSNNLIKVHRTRDAVELKETTKTDLPRIIPMNKLVSKILLSKKLKGMNLKYVFTEPDGKPFAVHHSYRKFKNAQIKAGMNNMLCIHDLRHTYASNFIMSGGSLFSLQKLLGHKQIATTMIYSHCSKEHLERSAEVILFGAKSFNSRYFEIQDEIKVNPFLTPTKVDVSLTA